jgi:hypothetical protein
MYKKFGYSVYRTVIGYYSGKEDALGKRKLVFCAVNDKSNKNVC